MSSAVTHLVNTHSHEDHIAGDEAVVRLSPKAETNAHPLALRVLRDPRREQPLHPYRHVMWGMPRPCETRAAEDGEAIRTAHHRCQVVFTPGRSDSHLCLFEPDTGRAFTRDLFVGGRERALWVGGDAWAIAAALRRTADLRPTLLVPGAAKVRDEAVPALLENASCVEKLDGRIVAMHDQERSEAEIVRTACGGSLLIELFTPGHVSRRGLVRSFLRGSAAVSAAHPVRHDGGASGLHAPPGRAKYSQLRLVRENIHSGRRWFMIQIALRYAGCLDAAGGGGWTRLITDTVVTATAAGTRRACAAYWRLIDPGGSPIRRTWRVAGKQRAKRAASWRP